MSFNWIKARYSFQGSLITVITTGLPPPLSLRCFPTFFFSAPRVITATMSLKPDFGPNGCNFPDLPVINDRAIEQQVFTHRSLYARPTHIFEDHLNDPSPDNEKFEHLGDSVLGLSVTSLMMQMYPGLRVGPSTKIRALIVGNATLAEISLKYRLPDRLRLHPAQAITLRASTHIQADVLESFIGGLYHEQGLDAVKHWLDALFRPYATAAYQLVRRQHGLPALPTPSSSPRSSPTSCPDTTNLLAPMTTIGHLALFNQHLQKSDRQVEWIYSGSDDSADPGAEDEMQGTKTTPVWFVKVVVDGEFYGKGRGNTKKAARNEAAKVGLEKMGIFVW
ncbi:ribonuclease III domain-containing protein [Lyophyllum atratum]|nr:ribonuclease III domain-containing protein [Lyophyllum atratum]